MADIELPDWEQIVEQHGKRVFRVANRILGSVHDAEDVSQEVFTEAYQVYQKKTVRNWTGLLVRLATLRAIDRLRQIRPVNELHDHDPVTTVEPYEELSAKELAQWLRDEISRLPDQQASVFVLMTFEKLSREEVAECLGITLEAVSTALYKARQRLKSQLSVFSEGESK